MITKALWRLNANGKRRFLLASLSPAKSQAQLQAALLPRPGWRLAL